MAGWAQAGGAAVSAAGSVLGGSIARGGVKRAGQVLKDASEAELDRIYARLNETNPMLAEAFDNARKSVTTTADTTGTHLEDVATGAGERAIGAGREANTLLDPYMQAGGRSATTLADLANAPEERFAFQFGEDDPSYRFRLAEGQKALERSAAARGTLLGGGTLKALTNYGQQAASQEYQNAYDRAMGAFKANQTGRQNRMSTLADLARMGGSAAERAGLNLTGTTQFAGELGTRAAGMAGGWRNQAAQLEGGWGIDSANAQVRNTLYAEEAARRMRLGGAEAEAKSIAGAADITGNMWAGGGKALGDIISMQPWKKQSNPWGGGGGGSMSDYDRWILQGGGS